jgi:hypothetical protein
MHSPVLSSSLVASPILRPNADIRCPFLDVLNRICAMFICATHFKTRKQ